MHKLELVLLGGFAYLLIVYVFCQLVAVGKGVPLPTPRRKA